MESPEQTNTPLPSKERVATYLYIGSLYFVAVGVLHLWGYWIQFGVDILEYMSLSDVLKSTALPITALILLTSLSTALRFLDRKITKLEGTERPNSTRTWRYWVTTGFWLILTLLLAWPTTLWLFAAIVLGVPLAILIIRSPWVKELLPNFNLRLGFVFIATFTLLGTLMFGHFKGYQVRTGQSFYFLTSELAGVTVAEHATPLERLRFLGHAGDSTFMYDPKQESLIISKIEGGKPLVLKHYHAKPETNLHRFLYWVFGLISN